MVISDKHADVLRELVNIGFGRAASSLSELTGQQVLLDVPDVLLMPPGDLGPAFDKLIPGKVATVHQRFHGGFDGDALLVLSQDSAAALSDMMAETHSRPHGLDDSDGEVLTEIGNILLNAFLGSFGNFLQLQIVLSVPSIYIESLNSLMGEVVRDPDASYAILITTNFRLRDSTVGGYVVMVFTVRSLDRLISVLDGLG